MVAYLIQNTSPSWNGYLKNLLKAGSGVRNGILTDGVHYFLRRVGEEDLPLQKTETRSIFERAEQAPRLREYLHSIISAPAENISPTAENLERHFGNRSDAFLAGNLLLKEAFVDSMPYSEYHISKEPS